MKAIICTIFILNAAISTACAAEQCDVPVAEWQPRESLTSKLVAQGWQVRSITASNGCYQAHVVDSSGKQTEVYFNPATLEPIMPEPGTRQGRSLDPDRRPGALSWTTALPNDDGTAKHEPVL